MAQTGIKIEGDVNGLMRKLKGYENLDTRGLNQTLAEDVRTSTLDRFKAGVSPDGRKWAPSIRAEQEGGQTLIRKGTLRNSIHSQADASGFAVGTNVKYAAEHQFGDERTIRARKKPCLCFKVGGQWVKKKAVTIRIPSRPYLGFSDEDMHSIRRTVDEFLEEV